MDGPTDGLTPRDQIVQQRPLISVGKAMSVAESVASASPALSQPDQRLLVGPNEGLSRTLSMADEDGSTMSLSEAVTGAPTPNRDADGKVSLVPCARPEACHMGFQLSSQHLSEY